MKTKKLEVKEQKVMTFGKPAVLPNSPATLIEKAIGNGANLENLQKLLEIQRDWEANEAKKAYHRSMTDFKANPPIIEKDKKVNFTSVKTGAVVKYRHATLQNVSEKINAELSKYGLSACWNVNQSADKIGVTCKITHELGHSESTFISAPADTTGSKNAIQSIGSTISYLERYSILALTGLATNDTDDDGKTSEPEKVETKISISENGDVSL